MSTQAELKGHDTVKNNYLATWIKVSSEHSLFIVKGIPPIMPHRDCIFFLLTKSFFIFN